MLPIVLFVDDDRMLRQIVVHRMEAYRDRFTLRLAADGRQALRILADEPVAVVVTDLQMPEMDGFALLGHLSQSYPEIPVIILTAFDSAENRRAVLTGGAVELVSKPIDAGDLAERITALVEENRSGGEFRSLPLEIFLHLIEQEKRTGTLRVNRRETSGHGVLFFNRGRLIDARCDDLRGIAAARVIVAWSDASYTLQADCPVSEVRIAGGLEALRE